MTVQNPPIFIQAGSHPAEDVRRWMSAMVEDTDGILASTDLAVTQNGTPNMSVDVAGGRAFINGDEATYQGTYFAENRGVSNLAVSASDPTNPRIDLVVARIKDAAYSGAANTFSLEVVTGTAAASPVAPAVPANSLLLATVAVAALATSITNANITDNHTRAYALGVAALNQRADATLAASSTANVTSISSEVALPDLARTWSVVVGQPYLLTLTTPLRFGTAGTAFVFTRVKADGVTVVEAGQYGPFISNERWTQSAAVVWTPASSSVSFTAHAETTVSTIQTNATASQPLSFSLRPVSI